MHCTARRRQTFNSSSDQTDSDVPLFFSIIAFMFLSPPRLLGDGTDSLPPSLPLFLPAPPWRLRTNRIKIYFLFFFVLFFFLSLSFGPGPVHKRNSERENPERENSERENSGTLEHDENATRQLKRRDTHTHTQEN